MSKHLSGNSLCLEQSANIPLVTKILCSGNARCLRNQDGDASLSVIWYDAVLATNLSFVSTRSKDINAEQKGRERQAEREYILWLVLSQKGERLQVQWQSRQVQYDVNQVLFLHATLTQHRNQRFSTDFCSLPIAEISKASFSGTKQMAN